MNNLELLFGYNKNILNQGPKNQYCEFGLYFSHQYIWPIVL